MKQVRSMSSRIKIKNLPFQAACWKTFNKILMINKAIFWKASQVNTNRMKLVTKIQYKR
jgi:hypothetical protein